MCMAEAGSNLACVTRVLVDQVSGDKPEIKIIMKSDLESRFLGWSPFEVE